jgi:HD-like signal output (HDOD) protein
MKQLIWMDSAVALTPVTIMALKKEIIHQLDDKLQLFLFKEMQRMGAERIRKLTVEKEILEKKNQELIDNIFSVRCRHNVEFGNTQLVQDLIKKIPRLPTSTLTLIHKLFDEKTSISEVAELVKNDPSLAGVVLKTINSSYYNFRQKISDMNHAIVLLGLNGVHQIIMAEKIRHSLPDTPVFQELHFHSLAISHIAFVICEASQAGRPSEMATIGLLHDIGRIVIELLKQQNPKLTLLIDSLDGAEMGAVLLRSWNLPKPVWQSIEYQFYPEFSPTSNIPDEVLENVTVLYLAHLCYHFLRKRSMEGLPTLFLDEYLSLLNRKAFSVPDIVHQFVLPALKKRINALPKFLAERVDTF